MSAIPLIVAVGDSLTWSVERHVWQAAEIGIRYGRDHTSYARYEMSKTYRGHIWMNLAFPGQQITHLETQAPLVDAILANMGATRRPILVVMIGSNPTSYTVATQAGYMSDYCADRRAAGWEIIICTLPSRTDGGTSFDSDYAIPLNAILRGAEWQAAAGGVLAVVDYAAMTVFAPDGANAGNTLYYSDLVHPTLYGGQVMGHLLQAAINDVAPFTGYTQQVEQFLDRLEAAGGLPSVAMIALYETFINALCAAGLWDAFHAIWLYCAETEAHALINVVNDTVTLTPTLDAGALTHAAYAGYTGAGAAQGSCLLTNFNPLTGASPAILGQNDVSIGLWSYGSGAIGAWDITGRTGVGTYVNNLALSPRYAGNYLQANVNATANVYKGSITDATGLYVAQRTAAGAQTIYKDGAQVASLIGGGTASTTPQDCSLFHAPMHSSRAFFIGRHLSASEHSTFYTLLSNFITAAVALGIAVMQTPPDLDSYNPSVDATVTCDPGTWDPPATSYFYQWFRADVEIPDETAAEHIANNDDLASPPIKCRVVAVNGSGESEPAFSPEAVVIS